VCLLGDSDSGRSDIQRLPLITVTPNTTYSYVNYWTSSFSEVVAKYKQNLKNTNKWTVQTTH